MPRLEEIPSNTVADAVAKAVLDAVTEGGDVEAIVARALARVKTDLALESTAPPPAEGNPVASVPRAPHPNGHPSAPLASGKIPRESAGIGRPVLTEGDVMDAARVGQTEIRLAPGTIVTSLARDAARDAGLRLVEG